MNISVNDTSWHSPYSILWQGIVWLVVFLLSLETIIGNAMVIVAYKIERSISKQVSNRYIVSLAISDLIIGIEGFPLFTVYVLNGQRWPLGAIACETWLFLDYTLCLVSILTVLLITADRYLSVCHTAKYLKWQSPTKTWILIIFSWIIPALIFGIMIYGWNAMTGSSGSMSGADCSAPFLTNPYVNMGMYVAYYWTTLVAMLILYKGIHQAAKNLETKAKAKERRHIALILSQRLGTQVGVSLMLQSRAEKEKAEQQQKAKKKLFGRRRGFAEPEPSEREIRVKEECEEEKNLTVIEEERSQFESFCRRESHELPLPAPNSSAANSRRESEEQDALLQNREDTVSLANRNRLSIKSTASRCSLADNAKRAERLERLNNNRPPVHQDSGNDSDNSMKSFKVRNSARSSRRKDRPGSTTSRSRGSSKRSTRVKAKPDRVEIDTAEPDNSSNRSVKWVTSMKKRIARALERRISTRRRERSSSSDSTSSSGEGYADPSVTSTSVKANVPQLVITEQPEPCVEEPLSPTKKSESFLSTASVTRKISSLSTTLTRERVISSIFAPISVFNRRRKQTKAEKRAHKAFRTITFIVGCFAILWSPYYIMATVYGFCKGECIPSFLYTLSYYMCYLNSSGNPFAYALANRQFRSAFYRIFRGNFHKNAT